MNQSSRVLAAQVITAVVIDGRSLNQALPEAKEQLSSPQDKALLQAICFGVFRLFYQLEFYVNQLVNKPLKKKDYIIQALLYVGIYQLIDMRIPSHAAVSETVNACKYLNKHWATRFVNGTLRNFTRQQTSLDTKRPKNLSAFYNHPQWFITTIQEAWPDEWKMILENNQLKPPLSIRLNLKKVSRESYLETLKEEQIAASPTPHVSSGVTIDDNVDVTSLPGFNEGLFYIQDAAAQLAAPFLQLEPKQRILDACAAPGGKTTQILEVMPTVKEVVALDSDEKRLKRLQENLQRLNLKATIQCAPANHLDAWWDEEPFDRILLDAPCSATGVIRRHPDIKILRKPKDIEKLSDQQSDLLQQLWPILKSGGILLYVTCSILPMENDAVVTQFVETQQDAKVVTLEMPFAKSLPSGYQIFPGTHQMDGFYYACLKKD